jgi:hypothetical protein
MDEPSGKAVGYETSDAEPRLIAWLAAGVVACLVISPVALRLLYPDAVNRAVVLDRISDIPRPRLQVDPNGDFAAFRRAEEARLSSYGWISRERRVVRLPIIRAMALTLERGLPGWQKP